MAQKVKRKRKCRYCDKLFTPQRATQVFCSAEHRRIFWDGMREVDPREFQAFLTWKNSRKISPPLSPLKRAPAGIVDCIADIPPAKPRVNTAVSIAGAFTGNQTGTATNQKVACSSHAGRIKNKTK